MSRIVFLGDLHGNIVATEAMAKTIEKIAPDEVWFLGDAVGKGPSNRETCDWVKEHCDHFLKGNWDEWIIESYLKREDKHSRYATENRFYYEQLGEERLMWLRSLPYEDEILISGLRIRLIHGRPVDQLYQGYDPDEKMKEGFYSSDKKTKFDSIICADSHRPYVRSLHDGYAVNTGSVGNSIGVPIPLMVTGVSFGKKMENGRHMVRLMPEPADCFETSPFRSVRLWFSVSRRRIPYGC